MIICGLHTIPRKYVIATLQSKSARTDLHNENTTTSISTTIPGVVITSSHPLWTIPNGTVSEIYSNDIHVSVDRAVPPIYCRSGAFHMSRVLLCPTVPSFTSSHMEGNSNNTNDNTAKASLRDIDEDDEISGIFSGNYEINVDQMAMFKERNINGNNSNNNNNITSSEDGGQSQAIGSTTLPHSKFVPGDELKVKRDDNRYRSLMGQETRGSWNNDTSIKARKEIEELLYDSNDVEKEEEEIDVCDNHESADQKDNQMRTSTHSKISKENILLNLFTKKKPMLTTAEILQQLSDAKNADDVSSIYVGSIIRHSLFSDVLNGHGTRVAIIGKMTEIVAKTFSVDVWLEAASHARNHGFRLTRLHVNEALTAIRLDVTSMFQRFGRDPILVMKTLDRLQLLMQMSKGDSIAWEGVFFARMFLISTVLVTFMDRQNYYRTSFPADYHKRDGLVGDWVITHVRALDYDMTVKIVGNFVRDVAIEDYRHRLLVRPGFNMAYRLLDLYFASDNLTQMISTIEECQRLGTNVAESSIAKMMQILFNFNHPRALEIFYKFRLSSTKAALATPDVSRLLGFFGRAGGGLPCPYCNEEYNHRNVQLEVWEATPIHMKQCPLLKMAREQRGEYEELASMQPCTSAYLIKKMSANGVTYTASKEILDKDSIGQAAGSYYTHVHLDPVINIPQCRDWSLVAISLFEFSQDKGLLWGLIEWRLFIQCCTFLREPEDIKEILLKDLKKAEEVANIAKKEGRATPAALTGLSAILQLQNMMVSEKGKDETGHNNIDEEWDDNIGTPDYDDSPAFLSNTEDRIDIRKSTRRRHRHFKAIESHTLRMIRFQGDDGMRETYDTRESSDGTKRLIPDPVSPRPSSSLGEITTLERDANVGGDPYVRLVSLLRNKPIDTPKPGVPVRWISLSKREKFLHIFYNIMLPNMDRGVHFDDMMQRLYFRFLRYYDPILAYATVYDWFKHGIGNGRYAKGGEISPVASEEIAIGAFSFSNDEYAIRAEAAQFISERVRMQDLFVTAFAKRVIRRVLVGMGLLIKVKEDAPIVVTARQYNSKQTGGDGNYENRNYSRRRNRNQREEDDSILEHVILPPIEYTKYSDRLSKDEKGYVYMVQASAIKHHNIDKEKEDMTNRGAYTKENNGDTNSALVYKARSAEEAEANILTMRECIYIMRKLPRNLNSNFKDSGSDMVPGNTKKNWCMINNTN